MRNTLPLWAAALVGVLALGCSKANDNSAEMAKVRAELKAETEAARAALAEVKNELAKAKADMASAKTKEPGKTAAGEKGDPVTPEPATAETPPDEPRSSPDEIRKFKGHGEYSKIGGLSFSPDGKQLLSASSDLSVRLWSVETGKELKRYHHQTNDEGVVFLTMAATKDGKQALVGGHKILLLLDVETMTPLQRLEFKPGMKWLEVQAVALSDDGQRALALGRIDDRIVYDSAGNYLPDVKEDGEYSILLRDTKTWKDINRFKSGYETCYRAAFLPSGRQALVGFSKHEVTLFDLENGVPLRAFPGGDSFAGDYGLAVSPDGKRFLMTDSSQGSVYLYDVESGKKLQGFSLPESFSATNVNTFDRVAFSPDGKRACFAGRFKGEINQPDQYAIVMLWDVDSWKELHRYRLPGSSFGSLAFSPNGRMLAVGTSDGPILLLRVPE